MLQPYLSTIHYHILLFKCQITAISKTSGSVTARRLYVQIVGYKYTVVHSSSNYTSGFLWPAIGRTALHRSAVDTASWSRFKDTHDFCWSGKSIYHLQLKMTIKNGQVHHCSLKSRFTWFISRNTLLNWFMPSEKLIPTANIWLSCTNYVISAGLLWWIGNIHVFQNK